MSKARTLANLISDNAELADGQISVAEVVGAAPTASPTFTGTVTTDAVTMNGNTTIGNSSTDTLTVRATTTFTNIGTGAAAGPYVNLLRDSSSPADDDFIGILSWQGKNDADQTVTYGQIAGRIADASDGSEDARIDLQGIVAGTTRSIMQYESGLTQFNAAGQDIDFKVHSTGNTHALFVDAGNNHVNIGTSADYNGVLNVFTPGNDIALSLASDNGNASVGPILKLTRLSSSPADGDLAGEINFSANNSAAETFLAKITARQDDVSNATEDSSLIFTIRQAGASATALELTNGDTVFNQDGRDRDFRVESDGLSHAMYLDASGNGTLIFGDSSTINGANGEFLLGSGSSSTTYFSIRNNTTSATTSASSRLDLGVWTNNGAYPNPSSSVTGIINFIGQGTDNAYAAGSIEGFLKTAGNRTRANTDSQLRFYVKDQTALSAVEYFRLSGDEKSVVFNQTGVDQDFRVESDNVSHMLFVDASSNRVGINISSVNDTLHVAAYASTDSAARFEPYTIDPNVGGADPTVKILSQKATALDLNRYYSHGTIVQFRHNNDAVGSIYVSGTSTSYNTSSDYRLKENVVVMTGATDRLKQLNPSRFNFIADADTTVDGFLAHEVQTVVPEAVTGTHNEVDADGNPVYQGIDQSKLVPLLVATIKELEARITALENA